MKKLILIGFTAILLSILTLFPGCGCTQEETANTTVEQPGNVLDPNFKGPDTPPFSNGPTEPPPSL